MLPSLMGVCATVASELIAALPDLPSDRPSTSIDPDRVGADLFIDRNLCIILVFNDGLSITIR
jgi:hypothetical protein